MDYTIISEREVNGKTAGEILTEKQLLDAGANIPALIEGNHITANTTTESPALQGDK